MTKVKNKNLQVLTPETTAPVASTKWANLEKVLKATGCEARFQEFLADCDDQWRGSFDFEHGRALPTVEGPFGSAPFNERITGLSEEQSAGNYLAYGQEVWDATSFIRRNIGLDDRCTDDNDRGSAALDNAIIGIAIEAAMRLVDLQDYDEVMAAAREVRGAILDHNCSANRTRKYAREMAAKKFRHFAALLCALLPEIAMSLHYHNVAEQAAETDQKAAA